MPQRSILSRKAVIAVLTLLLCSMLFSVGYIAAEAEHDCEGEECPVCVFIGICESVLRALRTAGVLLVIRLLPVFGAALPHPVQFENLHFATPVSLKVQMND